MHPAIERLRRVRAWCAGGTLDDADRLALGRGLDRALRGVVGLEEALGLPAGWQAKARAADLLEALGKPAGDSILAAAKDLHADLTKYQRSGRWAADLKGPVCHPSLYAIMAAHKGAVPSLATLRRLLSD